MPTVVRQDLDNSSAILTVTVTREDLQPKINSELKRFRQKVAIKGFRAGQVPIDHVKKLYGASILGDALNDMLADQLFGYLRDHKLDVLGQPLPTENQEKFSFNISNPSPEYAVSYEIGLAPAFDLKGLDKNEVFERLTISNLEALAEEELLDAQKKMSGRTQIEDSIQSNDMVRIASVELEGDSIKAGGWETDITILVNTVADENMRNQLLTLKKGDTLRFNARTMENFPKEESYRKFILGLEASDTREVGEWFEGTIAEVTRVEQVEMDEAFFKKYFGNSTITTYEAAIEELKAGIEQYYSIRSNAVLMRSVQKRLLEKNSIELPDTFLKRWLNVSNEGKLSKDTIEEQYPAFVENLRWTLIRDTVKDAHDVTVSDSEVEYSFMQKVRGYFGANNIPDQLLESSVQKMMENEKDVEEVRKELETEKIFITMRDLITVTDKAVTSDEFHKILEAITKQANQEQAVGAELMASIEE
jgi:trigger factor